MGYTKRNGRWANTEAVSLADGEVTATGTGDPVELGDRGSLRITLDVTAVAGDGAGVTVALETSPDGTAWTALGTAFTKATGAKTERKLFAPVDRFVRAKWTVEGDDPEIAFTLSGEAV